MTNPLRIAGMAALIAALAGCSSVNKLLGNEEDTIDYKSAEPVRSSLAVPPDLTQVPGNSRFQVPGAPGGTSYTRYTSEQEARSAALGAARQSGTLPSYDGMRIERDGEDRWLVIEGRPANEIFQRAVEFWEGQGFTLAVNDPLAGVIQTDWAENRAKIPQDLLRRTLGRVLDQVWDSGEREQFRTRLERRDDGLVEVYITHRQMVEQRVSESQFRWEPGPQDPGLNAIMLTRFMVALGLGEAEAQARLVASEQEAAVSGSAVVQGNPASGELEVLEPFDRAWRRIGLALERGNFTIEDRDRVAGQYYVRYVDVDSQSASTKEEPGLLGSIFGRSAPREQPQYRVQLSGRGEQTRISVLNAAGEPDNSETARRILTVLQQQLR